MPGLTILSLFGRSPFARLQLHMETVAHCVHCLPKLCKFLEEKNSVDIEQLVDQIFYFENEADLIKNDIRSDLSKNIYTLINSTVLLNILSIQDKIADLVQDVAVHVTVKPLELLPIFRETFKQFLQKNIQAFDKVHLIIKDLHELVEASFGGAEAKKINIIIDETIAYEREVDLIQRQLLGNLFEAEEQLSYATFYRWQSIFKAIGSISNLSENLANCIRTILEPT